MIPVALAVIVFSVSNRVTAGIDFWPLPYGFEVPIYVIVLASVLVGFLSGALVAWISSGRVRRRARASARQAVAAERELARVREKAGGEDTPPVRTPGENAKDNLPAEVSSGAA